MFFMHIARVEDRTIVRSVTFLSDRLTPERKERLAYQMVKLPARHAKEGIDKFYAIEADKSGKIIAKYYFAQGER